MWRLASLVSALLPSLLLPPLVLLGAVPANAVDLDGFDYIVVGSGAGGGPLAARLALAGRKTLLIEAGDDQGSNLNYTVPAYSARASEDGALAWNFFVRHYADDNRQRLDYKTSYQLSDGSLYTGLDPPPGAKMLGTLYPRTGTLGGCTTHNALVTIYPHRTDFANIASLTGDDSWDPDNMRKYFVRLEKNHYLLPSTKGHGFHGWLETEKAPFDLALTDPRVLSNVLGGAFAYGNLTNVITNLATVVIGDANADSESRDQNGGYYQTPLATGGGSRVGSREFVVHVRDAKNDDGSQRYPLTVRTFCHVTKIIFDNDESADTRPSNTKADKPPRAIGVEFLDGKYLYRASPRYSGAAGTPGTARANREVIIAGGAYNSPQILKLSGIGPRKELEDLGITVVKDLPGVGQNLQDHYEVAVQAALPGDFSSIAPCTFGYNPDTDPCLEHWENPPFLGNRGSYASNGLPVSMLLRSSTSGDGNFDIFDFGGPVNFRGYFPNYGFNITDAKNIWTWAVLKGHPRNNAGAVTLRSSDPLDVPDILYNYFDTGSGDYQADLTALTEGIRLARDAFRRQLIHSEEVLPGSELQSDDQLQEYCRNTAWGHHASSTCPIGPDGDEMAVLDSSFRVRGVQGLRVVDASVFPRIPGTFTAVSTYMVGEKAADVIMEQEDQLDLLGSQTQNGTMMNNGTYSLAGLRNMTSAPLV
ncbi:hypothetical protein CDD82_2517 [Ophiocordyceps australis]|uniref:Glucose-methanol-choline oxidoreductase N-terminal domain-containing protein n=1 Tax=Ophiocordyceps australis TaxID=1399860 RepID=A0A2C5YME1_9HYPO|nr:hypothetical protein CDD82_2517 [Ophiocordyceps australis]